MKTLKKVLIPLDNKTLQKTVDNKTWQRYNDIANKTWQEEGYL